MPKEMTQIMHERFASQSYQELRDSYLRRGLNPLQIKLSEIKQHALTLQKEYNERSEQEIYETAMRALTVRKRVLGR